MNKTEFTNKLMYWYYSNNRVLPWRDNPLPYYVWISEIMLQQTRVEAVIPYFNRFIEKVPDINSLANIEDDELYKLWEGLGYYQRVRNLKKAAKIIISDFEGILPNTEKEILSLPGIGPYTSGAVLSIAYGKKYSAVDGNVLRVFARLLEIKETIKDKSVKAHIKQKVESLQPDDRIGDFNQALMELGATVCLPNGEPKCEICPLNDLCKSNKNNTQNHIPVKQQKKAKKIEKKTVLLLNYNGKYHLYKNTVNRLLINMYHFPMKDGHLQEQDIKHLYPNLIIKRHEDSKHVFTHKVWDMIAYEVELNNPGDLKFLTKEELGLLPIPTAFKAYKKYVL